MLEFIADTAREAGLDDYKVQVNVGPTAGQTVFHLHWHVLGHKHVHGTSCPTRSTEVTRAMSLISEIEQDVKEATLARDAPRRDALRLILASLRSAEKDLQRPLSDDEELQVLQRERKRRIEAAEAFRAGGPGGAGGEGGRRARDPRGVHAAPLSEEELERIVDDAIAENGATSMRDMGRVMADVMPQIAGRADGSAVSQIVREKLA